MLEMPFHWVKITSSPPVERRDEVKAICEAHNARLAFDQIFYDPEGSAYALVRGPDDDSCEAGKLFAELNAIKVVFLVDADEKEKEDGSPEGD
jgi:hypothetical protein